MNNDQGINFEENLGQQDANITNKIKNVAKAAAHTVSIAMHPLVEEYAQLFTHGARTPVLRRPSDIGLEYEDVTFPSMDGVPLEAWFIPADSDKLLIINHPMPCNRYGFPGHIAPWNTMFGGFEVNLLPELKHLHDAGYNILTYDLRNHGLSGTGNGGLAGIGYFECRDVIGSLWYAKSHKDLANMTTGLYSRCMGGNSTIIAWNRWSQEFEHIKALVLLQAVSGRTFIEKGAERIHLDPQKAAQQLDQRLQEIAGLRLDELSPQAYAHSVNVPTLQVQVRRDFLIHSSDTQEIFDALGTTQKELFWIEGSDQRFYGYNYFGQYPEKLVGWFDRYMN